MTKPQIAALRVKIKSLAEECRMIRLEERRALGRRVASGHYTSKRGKTVPTYTFKYRDDALRLSLFQHRMGLRRELRAALLAYAFLRGKAYKTCEPKTGRHGGPRGGHNTPDLGRVQQIVARFGASAKSLVTKNWMVNELYAWVDGDLDKHPFAREVKAA